MADGLKMGEFVKGEIKNVKEKDRMEASKVVKERKSMVTGQIIDSKK